MLKSLRALWGYALSGFVWACAAPAALPQSQPPEPPTSDWQELFHQIDEQADAIGIALLQTQISIACPSNLNVLSARAREAKLGKECCNPALLKAEIHALGRLRKEISIEDPEYLLVLERLLSTWYLIERIEHMYCSEMRIPARITQGQLIEWQERFNEHRRWIQRSREETRAICSDLYAISSGAAEKSCPDRPIEHRPGP